jgi:hypothetical protein
VLSWRIVSTLESKEGLEHWKHILHEVSTRRCARITHLVCWIGTEVRDAPMFDGLTDVNTFLKEFEFHIPE